MDQYSHATGSVIHGKHGIRDELMDGTLGWLRKESACQMCTNFIVVHEKVDRLRMNYERERSRGVRLLFILAAMRSTDDYDMIESLRLMGTRGVDVFDTNLKRREQRAGEARRRPITEPRHYKRMGYPERVQQRVSERLYELVTRPDMLASALERDGAIAIARYL